MEPNFNKPVLEQDYTVKWVLENAILGVVNYSILAYTNGIFHLAVKAEGRVLLVEYLLIFENFLRKNDT